MRNGCNRDQQGLAAEYGTKGAGKAKERIQVFASVLTGTKGP